ncbi:MAG: type II toxin-antitoxin system PemK/MazF family toxin [Sphingomonadales bacterium]
MTSLRAGDLVWVAFPYVETNQTKSRPALIISSPTLGPQSDLAWMAMITNAANAPWPGDIAIKDFKALGLPIPSVIRTEKVSTLEIGSANFVSRLPALLWHQVASTIQRHLAIQ